MAQEEFLIYRAFSPVRSRSHRAIATAQDRSLAVSKTPATVGRASCHPDLQNTSTPFPVEGVSLYFHRCRVSGVEIERGMPYGGRQGRSRRWPGSFVGRIAEDVSRPSPRGRDLRTWRLPRCQCSVSSADHGGSSMVSVETEILRGFPFIVNGRAIPKCGTGAPLIMAPSY